MRRHALACLLLAVAGCRSGSTDGVRRTPPPSLAGAAIVDLSPSVFRQGGGEVPWGRAGATLSVTLDIDAPEGLDLGATSVTFTGVPLEPAGDGVWSRVLDGTEGDGPKELDVVLVDDLGQQVRLTAEDLDLGSVGFDFTAPAADCVISPQSTNATQDVSVVLSSTERLADDLSITPTPAGITLGEPTVSVDGRQIRWSVGFEEATNYPAYTFDIRGSDEVGNVPEDGVFCGGDDPPVGERIGAGPALDGDIVVSADPFVDDGGVPLVRAGARVEVVIPTTGPPVVPDTSTVTLSGIDLTWDPTDAVWFVELDGTEGDGPKSLDARLFDSAGNSTRLQQTGVIRFDFTAPTATCVISPKNANGSDAVTLTVRASEALPTAPTPISSDPALTIGPPTTAGTVHTYALSVGAEDVAYTLTLPATDRAGNDADLGGSGENTLCVEAERQGSILAVGPSLTGEPVVQATPSVDVDGTPWVRAEAEIQVTFPTDEAIDPARSTVTLSGTPLSWDATDARWEVLLDGTEGDGPKDLQATLADAAGNPLPVTRDDVVRFDFTAPVADCVITPAEANGLQDVRFDLFPSETLEGRPLVTSPDVALTADAEATGWRWGIEGPADTDTTYVLSVIAADRVGNTASGDAVCAEAERTGRINAVLPSASAVTLTLSGANTFDAATPIAGDAAVVTVDVTTTSDLDVSATVIQAGEIRLDHVSGTTWQHTVSSSDIDGRKPLSVELVDTTGNRAPADAAEQAVVIDLTAPSATCTLSPPLANAADSVTFALSPTEPLAETPVVASTAVTVGTPAQDGARWISTVDAPAAADTSYVLAVGLTDRVGNTATDDAVCPEPDRSGRVQAIAPGLHGDPILSVSPSTYTDGTRPWARAGDTVTVTLDPVATIDPASTLVTLSGLELSTEGDTDGSFDGRIWTLDLDGTEGDGLKDLRIQLVDDVGNTTTVTVDDAVRFDFTAPSATCSVSPNPANAHQTVIVALTATETLDGAPVLTSEQATVGTPTSSGARWTATVDTPDDAVTAFVVDATLTDRVGNQATGDNVCAEADRSGLVDAALPAATSIVLDVAGTNTFARATGDPIAGDEAILTVTIAGSDDLDPQATTVLLGDIALAPQGDGTWTHTVSDADSDGRKALAVTLVDVTGNRAPADAADQAIVIDLTAPTAACSLSPGSANATQPVTFSLTPSEALDDAPDLSSEDATIGTAAADGARWTAAIDTPDDTDTTYVVEVSATDRVGNTASSDALCPEADRTGTVDGTLPGLDTPPILTVSPSTYTDGDRPWARAGDTVTVILDPSEDLEVASTLVTLSGLALTHQTGTTWSVLLDGSEGDGLKDLRVQLVDVAGNQTVDTVDDAVRFDFTAPTASCALSPQAADAADAVVFSITPSEVLAESPTVTSASLAVGTPTEDGPRWTMNVTAPDDVDTGYTLAVSLTDRIGNTASGDAVCPEADRTGTVDGTLPGLDTPPILTVSPSTYTDGTRPWAKTGDTVTVVLDPSEGLDVTATQITLSGLALTHQTDATWSVLLDGSEGDGLKDLRVQLVDDAGNQTIETVDDAVRFDFTAPAASCVISPQPANGEATVRFTLEPLEPLASAPVLSSETVALGDPTKTGVRWVTEIQPTPETDVSFTLDVDLTDRVGNQSTGIDVCSEADRTGVILGAPPVVTATSIDVTPSIDHGDGTRRARAGAVVTVTLTTDDTFDPDSSFVALGGIALDSTDGVTWSALLDGTEGDGRKSLFATLRDEVGNVLDLQDPTVAFVADFTAPGLTVSQLERTPRYAPAEGPGTLRVTTHDPFTAEPVVVSLEITATEALGATATLEVVGPASWTFDIVEADVWNTTVAEGQAEGDYTFEITLEDEVGNAGTVVAPWTLTVDTTAEQQPPEADVPDAIVYDRAPWGTVDTGPRAAFSVQGQVGSTSAGLGIRLTDALGALVGQGVADATGAFGPLALSSGPADLRIASLDAAGNASADLPVRDVRWVATMGGKVRGAIDTNPHLFSVARIAQPGRGGATEATDPDRVATLGTTLTTQGEGRMEFATGPDVADGWPDPRTHAGFGTDFARGQVIYHRGTDLNTAARDVYVWDGNRWSSAPDADSVANQGPWEATTWHAERQELLSHDLRDVLAWNGEDWEYRVSTGGRPGGAGAMVWDPTSQDLLMPSIGIFITPFESRWRWADDVWWVEDNLTIGTDAPRGRTRWVSTASYPPARQSLALNGQETFGAGFHGEFWVREGSAWENRAGDGPTPPANSRGPTAYDPFRRVVWNVTDTGDTWTWNGETWANVTSTLDPPLTRGYRVNASLAYDPTSRAMFLLGGGDSSADDTLWVFDGAGWTRRDRPTFPDPDPEVAGEPGELSPRGFGAATVDPITGDFTYLHGSNNASPSSSSNFDEHWRYDGERWTLVASGSTSPPARQTTGAVLDETRGEIVLFGGTTSGWTSTTSYPAPLGDTWLFDGEAWTQFSGSSPPARWDHMMTWDDARQEIVLFGGRTSTNTTVSDTWVWNGTSWLQRTPPTSPPPNRGASMGYDRTRQEVVLWGGLPTAGFAAATWAWDGTTWTQLHDGEGFTEEFAIVGDSVDLTWEPVSERLLVAPATRDGALLAWDGSGWEVLATDAGYSPRRTAGAYVPSMDRVVWFGGRDLEGRNHNDAWSWNGGRDLRPAQTLDVDWTRAGAEATDVTTVTVRWIAGAEGYPGGGFVSGASLQVWDGYIWREVTSHTAPDDAPATLCWQLLKDETVPATPGCTTLVDAGMLQDMFVGADRTRVHARVVPVAPNGGVDPRDETRRLGRVTTDAVEVEVTYRRSDGI